VLLVLTMAQKRKNVVLCLGDKMKVIEKHEKGYSLACIAAEFGIGKSTVHGIVRIKEDIKKICG